MTKFLEQTAGYLVQKYGEKIPELCIVLPNRRAGLFLKKYLGNLLGKTIWSPAIYSIEDFLVRISGLHVCDNIQALFELHSIHQSLEGKNAQPFNEFSGWAQQLLGDFNEIDSYMVDAGALFSFITEAKALSVWNLENKPLTDFEKQYLAFFHSLSGYHEQLKTRLLASNLAWPGLLFRKTAEQIKSLDEKITGAKVIFAGFNALTKAEEVIIDHLVTSGKAELIWDSDAYYQDDEKQEAGFFLRMWLKKWKNQPFNWIGKNFADSTQTIRITGVPLHIGQAKRCGELLAEYLKNGSRPEEIAVVMTDEQLLLPVLNSLPPAVKELNITMGLPLRQTPVYDLLDTMFRMHENTTRFTRSGEKGTEKFYYRDILRILQHPYAARMSAALLQENAFALDDLISRIRSGNRVFIGKDDLMQSGSDLFTRSLDYLEPVFEPWQDPVAALDCLRKIIAGLRDGFMASPGEKLPKAAEIEVEFLYAFSKIIFRLSALNEKFHALGNLSILHNLFGQLASSTSIPFYGEPLRGVQMMGMLETRTLDFDHLILLSVNEDILPGGKTQQSFIPSDIRHHFRLPTYRHKNAIYAYHFYRLLQRAKQVELLYNTESDELGGGEKSRFIRQILHELRKYNPGIKIEEEILVTSPLRSVPLPAIKVTKTGDVRQKLLEKAVKGLSPTALNHFIQCTLKFYFQDLIGLEEEKETEETIDSQVLGQAVHEALKKLYDPFKDTQLTTEHFDVMLGICNDEVDKAFVKKFKGSDVAYGKNLLLVRVAKILVKKFLQKEKEETDTLKKNGTGMTVYYLEKIVRGIMEIPFAEGLLKINLKGFVDRIDKVGQEWRIIDYKSGSVLPSDLKFTEWKELKEDPDLARIVQLYFYSWLFAGSSGEKNPKVRAGIISLKKLNNGFMEVPSLASDEKNLPLSKEDFKEFEQIVREILLDIYDLDVPFMQTEDVKRCENCDFVSLCGR